MSVLAGLPVLTAAAMRAAEAASGMSPTALEERAGAGIARWTARLAAGAPITVLCGPGNNGGDGYVAARLLRAGGATVRVAAWAAPRTEPAQAAAAGWSAPIDDPATIGDAPLLVDALFGTGGRAAPVTGAACALLVRARRVIAVDLPSGLDADAPVDGPARGAELTLALGALKPAHLLQPGTALCGVVRVIDLGLSVAAGVTVLDRPSLAVPGPTAHKYSRGLVAVVGGAMPGAARLAARAALRGGAGYVSLLGPDPVRGPDALVHRPFTAAALDDRRIGCVVVGPGLGRDDAARDRLEQVRAATRPLVIDGDALHLLDPDAVPGDAILTPHAGEFAALFGAGGGSKLDRTRAAAARAGAVVVHKGADTVIAAPDGRVVLAPPASGWLATAGSGDVLAGVIAAQWAGGADAFAAACAGVWLHARAAALLGGGLIADDLPAAIGWARARR